ncbi:type II CAAX prenyl endopeptidase Rce1 family protein [Streptomyces formicae]|uniref:CAAX amino terminal protease family n=1 Tax=Streptomyces formicae TaxID=1616117 RepID=A0A291QN25_9ACTN|nr:CPBP family glutamic-type intramembrane protease [Streptomyces formicae]ATL32894.1 CAAX amino terminal protease family [Streptomyces formicae]
MPERTTTPPAPSLLGALGRALGGGLVMGVALGLGTAAGPRVADALGLSGFAARLVPAVLVSAVAVPLVMAALRRGGRSLTSIGFGDPMAAVRALLTGVGVTAAAAAVVLGAGTAAGMLSWSRPDPFALAAFLVTNGVVALLLEALPEETTLRGYAWTALRGRFGGLVTALGTTAVFLVVPGLSTVVGSWTARLVGGDPGPVGWAPGGQNAADYLFLLTVFGLTLVAARTAVRGAPLYAAIGTHLTFLTVNRVTFEGEKRDAGWHAELLDPGAELLVPVYLLVAMAGFVVWRKVGRRGPYSTPRSPSSPSSPSGGRATARRTSTSAATVGRRSA